MKITPKQKEALLAVQGGTVETVNTGYASLRIQGGNPNVMGRLGSMGLVKRPLTEGKWTLTEKGQQALAEN